MTQYLKEKYPKKRIYLAGFSLGGNVALKYLGELGGKARGENIFGAAVACVPFDQFRVTISWMLQDLVELFTVATF